MQVIYAIYSKFRPEDSRPLTGTVLKDYFFFLTESSIDLIENR